MLIHLENEALPVDPCVHFPSLRADLRLKPLFGVGGQEILRFVEREDQFVARPPVEVTEHESRGSHAHHGSEVGQHVRTALVGASLPGHDVVKGIVGVAVRAVVDERRSAQLETQLSTRTVDQMGGEAHTGQRVALRDVAVIFIVFEKGKRIRIEIEGLHLDGIRIVLRRELTKEVDLGGLRSGHRGHEPTQEKQPAEEG